MEWLLIHDLISGDLQNLQLQMRPSPVNKQYNATQKCI